MSHYQGRAIDRRGAPGGRPLRQSLRVLAVMAVLGALAMLPWRELRRRYATVTFVRVEGLRYLDAARVRREAGLAVGQDLLSLDLGRVRRQVLLDPRIERAEVHHLPLRGIDVRIVERVPALAIVHGTPWELDSAGVLLEPLEPGVVADVPLLTGLDVSGDRPGTQLHEPGVQRGLAWAAVLSDNALRLGGEVSEVDVSESRTTRLVLMNGVRVLGPAWPVDVRQLSGLRATLADLEHKGVKPGEVDVRIPDQIIVRDVHPVAQTATDRPRITG